MELMLCLLACSALCIRVTGRMGACCGGGGNTLPMVDGGQIEAHAGSRRLYCSPRREPT